MELVTPGIGLVFWMMLSFIIVFYVLRKFAWKPILKILKEREENIEKALKTAEEAKLEMQKLRANNEQIVAEARRQADVIVKEAREVKDKIITEAKQQATVEGEKIIKAAKQNIENEKIQAMNEIRNYIADLSVLIAEKVIKKEFAEKDKQKEYINKLLNEINFN